MRKAVFLLLTMLLITISGCGGGSSSGLALTGSLTMEALLIDETGGYYHSETTAKYTHPTKDSTGVELSYSVEARTRSGVLLPYPYSFAQKAKQASGGVIFTSVSIPQTTEAVTLDITVSAGDLVKYSRLTIPALTPLAVKPVFINMSTGLSQTVAVSGSIGPYTISVPPAGLFAGIDNSTSTLTISEATFQKLNGTVTVYSSLGESIIINVRY